MLRFHHSGYKDNPNSRVALPSSIFRRVVEFRSGIFTSSETSATAQRMMMLRTKVRGEEWQGLLNDESVLNEEEFNESGTHATLACTRLHRNFAFWTFRRVNISRLARESVAYSSYSSLMEQPLSTAATKGSDDPMSKLVPFKSLSRIVEDSVSTMFTDSDPTQQSSPSRDTKNASPGHSSSNSPQGKSISSISTDSKSNSSPRTDMPDWALMRAPSRHPYRDSAAVPISMPGSDPELVTYSNDFPLNADTDLLIKAANGNLALKFQIQTILGSQGVEIVDLTMGELAVLLRSYGVPAKTIAKVTNRWARLMLLHEISRREEKTSAAVSSSHFRCHQQSQQPSKSPREHDYHDYPTKTTPPPCVLHIQTVPNTAKMTRPSVSLEWIEFEKKPLEFGKPSMKNASDSKDDAVSEISVGSSFSAKSRKFDPRKRFWRHVAEKEAKEYEGTCRFYV
jgi:hypothetical protein